MKNDKVALIIMIKNPILGKAKTRIAAEVGVEEALRIYNLLLGHTRKVTELVSIDRYLYYSDYIEDDEWSEKLFYKRVQSQGDLGERLRNAYSSLSHEYDKIIVIGSDCASLRPNHITSAAKALDSSDMVIGPVHDGGYYLLGMNGYYPELITDIEWSTAQVTDQTIHKAENLKLKISTIDLLSDIDYYEDWLLHGSELEN